MLTNISGPGITGPDKLELAVYRFQGSEVQGSAKAAAELDSSKMRKEVS